MNPELVEPAGTGSPDRRRRRRWAAGGASYVPLPQGVVVQDPVGAKLSGDTRQPCHVGLVQVTDVSRLHRHQVD